MTDRIKVEVDECLRNYIPGYLDDIGKWTEVISTAAENGDFQTIRQLTHKMAGSGAGYGFDYITRAGREANRAAHEKDPALVVEWIEKLKAFLGWVEVVYVADDKEVEF